MLMKSLTHITEDFLFDLPTSDHRETEMLDYKLSLTRWPGSLHKAVCAMANSMGGDIVVGIRQGTGDRESYPEEVVGVSHPDLTPDQVEQRYVNTSRTGIEPKPNVNVKCVRLQSGKDVVVIRVNRSAVSPHRVSDTSKFYRRVGTQSVEMDISDIRNAFNLGANLDYKIEQWRSKRVGYMISRFQASFAFFHVIPVDSLFNRVSVDLGDGHNFSSPAGRADHFHMDINGRIATESDLDGLFAYTHLARNGIVEYGFRIAREGESKTWKSLYDKWIKEGISRALGLFQRYSVSPPAVFRGYMYDISQLKLPSRYGFSQSGAYDMFDVELEQVQIERWSDEEAITVRPMLDQIWNGFGLERCATYDQHGKWDYPD